MADSFFDKKAMNAMKKVMQQQTPYSMDNIATQLYMFPDKIQFCHHLTLSYAQHKALDGTYETIDGLKDEIIEKLTGYTGKRFTKLNLTPISGFTEEMPGQLAQEIVDFGYGLYKCAGDMHYCDIENLAQSYSGAGAQLAYLLTLK